jgi:hypothetical protein
MRRFVVMVLLVITVASTASCSMKTPHASPVILPLCGPEAPDATYSSTTTAPCAPTSTTTTSTTLPAPMALGSVATLTDPFPTPADRSQITVSVSRIWMGVIPTPGTPGFDLAHALRFVNAPASFQWVGVKLTMANTGQQVIGLVSASGPGAATLSIVVNGQRLGQGNQETSSLPQIGFEMGVAGCAYPFAGGAPSAPGSRGSGCLAVPIPEGLNVTSLGFDLTNATGGAAHYVALWRP